MFFSPALNTTNCIAIQTDPLTKHTHQLDDRDIIVLPFSEMSASDLPPMDKEPPIPYDYDPANVSQFLSMICDPNDRAKYRQLIDNTQKITLEMLKRGIRQCVEAINPLLYGKDFAWGFEQYKSCQWVGTYACKFLATQPRETFSTSVSSRNRIENLRSSHLVIFDDAIYSGWDTQNIIESLQLELKRFEKEYVLYLVCPFVSERALKWLKEDQLLHNLHIKLITTDHRIQTWQDRCPSIQIATPNYYFYQAGNPTHLALPQWKIPDLMSFPFPLVRYATQGPAAPWHYDRDWKGEKEYRPLIVPDIPPVYKLDS